MKTIQRMIQSGGRKIGRTIRLRLRAQDHQIEQVLEQLPEGERSEYIRDAILKKIEGGSTVETTLNEIRQDLKTLVQRQGE